jgi:hypothetical protein
VLYSKAALAWFHRLLLEACGYAVLLARVVELLSFGGLEVVQSVVLFHQL